MNIRLRPTTRIQPRHPATRVLRFALVVGLIAALLFVVERVVLR